MLLDRNKPCSHRIKIIHLLRDPRGKVNSHLHLPEGNELDQGPEGTRRKVEKFCPRISKDVTLRKQLEAQYPGSFLELRYEDIADDLLSNAEKVFKFVWNAKPPAEIYSWIKVKTDATEVAQVQTYVNTFRRNSSRTARKWMNQLRPKMIKFVESYCEELIRYLGLDFVYGNDSIYLTDELWER